MEEDRLTGLPIFLLTNNHPEKFFENFYIIVK